MKTRQCTFGLCLALFAVTVTPAYGQTQSSSTPSATGTAPSIAPSGFRMIQASAGSKQVERNGRIYFEDPRNVFRLGDDHKVVVEFQWNGPTGPHKFQAMWKDPSGKVVVVTNFDFEPKGSPYSGLFTMLMDETAATGIWTVDAAIDGQTAGSYSFEIVPADSAAPSHQPPPRIPLTSAEVYRQSEAAAVFVDKLDSSGKTIGHGSGFFMSPKALVTAFENIDGATNLRISLPNGQTLTTDQVAAWDRWQDWAVLGMSTGDLPALKPTVQNPPSVGDNCFSLGPAPGGRTLVSGGIVGTSTQPRAGQRLSLSFIPDSSSVGAPIVNEFGDVIGMAVAEVMPGLRTTDFGSDLRRILGSGYSVTGLAVPIDLIKMPAEGQNIATLADLASKGLFLPEIKSADLVGFAALALGMDPRGRSGMAWPRDTRTQFSVSDRQMTVFVNWTPKVKFKGVVTARFYDLDNKQIGQSLPSKINLQPDQFPSTLWTVPLNGLVPGIYRIDVWLGDVPVWREFFRVVS